MRFNNIFSLAISIRLIIYIILIFFPLYHNSFGYISPVSFQSFADYNFFSNFGEKRFTYSNFLENYFNVFNFNIDKIDNRFPGPLFPLILKITFYDKNFTYILSLVILISEIASCYLWSKYFYNKINYLCALLFCLMPIPLFFGFLHSSDIIFYLFTSLFIISFKNNTKDSNKIFLLIILFLLRPTAISFLIFLLLYLFFKKSYKYFFVSCFLFFLISIYYIPYFFYELMVLENADNLTNENKNLFNNILIYIKKIFLVLGFTKSESGNLIVILGRYFCGIIFSIGFLYLFFKKNLIDIFIILCVLLPIVILFFPAYRYSLPIIPLLYMYSFLFFSDVINKLRFIK